jgi:hypothetical protein
MRMIVSLILFPLALSVMAGTLRSQTAPGTPAPGIPLPADSPQETAAPELLPRSDALPDPAPLYPNLSRTPKAGRPAVPADSMPEPTPYVSAEQRRIDEQRLEKIRALASRNPESVALLKLASTALSVEARRNYLRAYYVTVCMRMRQLEPRLGGYIREFERDRIRAIGRSKDPRIPSTATK